MNCKKETGDKKKGKDIIVDGVNITKIVDDLYKNHKWLMKKLAK